MNRNTMRGARQKMRPSRVRVVSCLAAAAGAGLLGVRSATAANETWIGGNNGAWLTAANWSPTLGTATGPAPTDVAQFDSGAPTAVNIGVNLNSANNNGGIHFQSVGEIVFLSTNTVNRSIGNSSTSAAGSGTLTINGVGGVYLANQSTSSVMSLVPNIASTPTTPMAIALGGTAGAIDVLNSSAISISANVSGAVDLTKTGTGTLTLSGANTFGLSKTFAISGGSVLVNNTTGSGTGDSAVTVASAATLGGSGIITGTVNNSGILSAGSAPSTAGTLTTGAMTLQTGSSISFDISSTTKDKFVTGGLTLPATANSVLIDIFDLGGGVAPAIIPLFTYTGSLGGSFAALKVNTTPTAPAGTQFNLLNNAGEIDLQIVLAAASLVWKGQNGSAWDVNTTANWVGGVAGKFNNGDFTTFDDSATGPTSITVAAGGVSPASMTFTNTTGVPYTIGGAAITGTGSLLKTGNGLLTLNGANSFNGGSTINAGTVNIGNATALGTGAVALSSGAILQFGANVAVANAISVGSGGATIDINGKTASITTAMTGSGLTTYQGGGTLTLTAPAPSLTGGSAITAGTVSVSSVNSNGVTGVGTGFVTVSGTGVFEVNGVHGGFNAGGTPGTALLVRLNNGGTLQGRGDAWVTGSGGFIIDSSGSMTLSALNAGDKLLTGNSIRNPAATVNSTAVLNVTGAGNVYLASGGTSQSVSGTQFSGTWVVSMDNNTGVFSLGPVAAGGFGELLNALGYQAPTQTGLTARYGGITRPVTLNSGTIAFGSDTPNFGAGTHPDAISYRSPMTINGGKLASSGFEIDPGSPPNGGAIITTTPVTANLAADITLSSSASASVLLYDPAPGAPVGVRSLNVMNDPNALTPGANVGDPAIPVPSNFTWGAGSTLAVVSNGTAGGALNFSRTTGTITVGTGAAITVDATAAVNVGKKLPPGASSVLTDVPTALDPFTDSTALAGDTTKSVGATVTGKLTYVAQTAGAGVKEFRLSSLSVQNGGLVKLDAPAAVSDRTILRTGAVAFAGTGAIDLTRNEMILAETESNVRAAIVANRITTTSSGGAVGSLNIGSGNMEVRYTLLGDTNLDAKVDVTDLGNLASNYGAPSGAIWVQGDTNYDNTVDVTDLGNLASNYGADLGGGAADSSMVAQSLASVSGSASAVPEPASLGLIGLGMTALLGRRRRNA